MTKHLFGVFFILTCTGLFAQSVNWAVNVENPPTETRLVVDHQSNLYLYGYTEMYYPSDLDGSFFRKYAPSGELLFSKDWKAKVFISRMIGDGEGSFYFCGYFKGVVNDQGIHLESNGGTDGFLGKMNTDGKVQWTVGFGGARDDKACDLTFNADSTEIVFTGGIDSTVVIYDYPLLTTPQAIFVARMDLNGGLLSYKTHVFSANEHGDNIGLEIENRNGGYYLLADRMGDHWNNDVPSGSPLAGRYLFNLNENMEILWSKYIISSSCYYGYSCRNMSVQNNEACVPSFCSAKYGGTGRLQKFGSPAGEPTWTISNNDGTYYDTHAAGNRVFYVGNEEANGCPCQDNNPGFARVKMIDENNADQILISKYGFHFYSLTQAPNGNVYVFGYTNVNDPHLQGQKIRQGYFLFSMQSPPASFKGIDQEGQDILTIYPNPSSGYMEIVHDQLMEEITVVNGNGMTVRQLKPEAKAYTIRDLDPGYYLVRVKYRGGSSHSKVIVVR